MHDPDYIRSAFTHGILWARLIEVEEFAHHFDCTHRSELPQDKPPWPYASRRC